MFDHQPILLHLRGVSKITYPTIDGQSCAEISFENVQLDEAATCERLSNQFT